MDFSREFPDFFDKYRTKGLYLVIKDELIVHATGDTSLVFGDLSESVDVLERVPALYGVADDEGYFEFVSSDSHSPVDIFYKKSDDTLLVYLSDARSSINAIVDKQQMRNELHVLNQELKAQNTYIEKIHHLQTQFVSSISHEFRTPITSVLGNLDLIKKEYQHTAQFDEEALDSAHGSASYLSLMINNVLDYASSSLNHLIIIATTVDSRQLVHEIKQMFSLLAKKKNLHLKIESDDVPDTFIGDAIRIKQVLVNLVSNAIKYTDKGSVLLKVSATDEQFAFSVKDTGSGIAEDKKKTIFHPFVRDDANQYMAMGAGLGLTIAKTLVEKMGGQLNVESQIGVGSEFAFTIPYDKQFGEDELSASPDTETDFSVLKDLNVLVAEDNDDVADLLFAMLGLYGCKVKRATNGRMAIELVKEYSPEIVLMDINMPITNGLEASVAIKEFADNLPIIGLSASINLGEDLQQYVSYFDRLCSKPFKIDELVEIMCDLLKVEE